MSTFADLAPEIARHCACMGALFEWPSHADSAGDDMAHLLDALRDDLCTIADIAEVWTPQEQLVDNIERLVHRIADENRRERAELLDVPLDAEALDDWDALDSLGPADWVAIEAADLLAELAAVRRLVNAGDADPAEIAERLGRVVARLPGLVGRYARLCTVAPEAPAQRQAERGQPMTARSVATCTAPHAPPAPPCARPRLAHASSARCHSRKEAAPAD